MNKGDSLVEARYVITGQLVLEAPAHFGDGTQGDDIDMPLLRDKSTGQAFVPGSSIAGALRSYAYDYLHGYRYPNEDCPFVSLLFGRTVDNDNEATLSNLRVFDSYSLSQSREIRDGLKIDPKTGVAAENLLFQTEVLPKNTSFRLYMELNIPRLDIEDELVSTLLCVLQGLENGEIPLGARKSRGFGRCQVQGWQIRRFDLTEKSGWLEWLALVPAKSGPKLEGKSYNNIREAISEQIPKDFPLLLPTDQRRRAIIELNLKLEGGVLVRSPGLNLDSADASHICTDNTPVLPGTSLAGVFRTRALKIAQLIRKDKNNAEAWVDSIFGDQETARKSETAKQLFSSQLFVNEGTFRSGTTLRVNRIKMDRFTGGVLDNHLFDEEPLYGAQLNTTLELRIPYNEDYDTSRAKLGLLLLCVKDLLNRDLPVGGTSSVGRGYFDAGTVTVKWYTPKEELKYHFSAKEACSQETARFLNGAVNAFHKTNRVPGRGKNNESDLWG